MVHIASWKRDISNLGAKRISLIVVLQTLLTIEQIRKVARNLLDQYKSLYDVVWIYIAKNGDDYIMSNWITRGQWINPELDKQYKPLPLKIDDGKGYYREENSSYSTLNEHYSKYVFDDDKVLYVCNQKIYDEISPIYYKELMAANENHNADVFIELVNKHKDTLLRAFMQLGEFGHSRNKEFDDFLNNYQSVASALDNLPLWIVNDKLTERELLFQINSCLIDAKKHIDVIENGNRHWREFLSVTEADYAAIDPYNRPKHDFQYEQTIPISTTAINVSFDTIVCRNTDNTFKIVGTTNLFNHASLMLSVTNTNGKMLGQSKSNVFDGRFEFEKMSIKGAGYLPGRYKANISLSIPSVQPKDFTKIAGIEYENLTGPFVERTGIGPMVNYDLIFEIV